MDKLRALVVDDESSVCEAVRAILELEGLDVTTTISSVDAVKLAEESSRCLYPLCDLHGCLPGRRVTPLFPGPKQAGPGAERFRRPGDPSVDEWIDLCIGCHLCDMVCSSGVNISELNLLAKAKYLDEKGRPLRDCASHAYLSLWLAWIPLLPHSELALEKFCSQMGGRNNSKNR